MKKRTLKKSDVLREGYIKGLKKAQRVINEILKESRDLPESYVVVAYDEDDAKKKAEKEFGAKIYYCRVAEWDVKEYDPDMELDWDEHLYELYRIEWED